MTEGTSLLADRRVRTSLIAIGADMTMIGIKAGTAWITGSVALAADALHSLSDLLVSLLVLTGLILRRGQEQRAGGVARGQRIESAIALVVALIILYVPLEILREVQQRETETIQYLWVGILGVLVVIAVAFLVARLKILVGREADSPALEADGYHSRMDVLSSVAVLFSLVGQMIGLHLDNVVAVVIAVMVAIVGVELLVSGLRSLIRGGELEQLSLIGFLSQAIPGNGILRRAGTLAGGGLNRLRRPRVLAGSLGLLFLAYLASGLTVVPLSSLGVRQRLGAVVDEGLPPGLHYRWPWPFERILVFPSGRVQSVVVRSREAFTGTRSGEEPAAIGRLWRRLPVVRRQSDDSAEHLVTADENLVDLELAVHYRTHSPIQVWRRIGEPDLLVAALAGTAMRSELAAIEYDQVLGDGRTLLVERIRARIRDDLREAGLPLEILDVMLKGLQPAAPVVHGYRAIENARQEYKQALSSVQAERGERLLLANAERSARDAEAQAAAGERRLHAIGDAARFTLLAEITREHGTAVGFDRYLDAVVEVLADRRLLITEAGVNLDDPRLRGSGENTGFTWLPAPSTGTKR